MCAGFRFDLPVEVECAPAEQCGYVGMLLRNVTSRLESLQLKTQACRIGAREKRVRIAEQCDYKDDLLHASVRESLEGIP